MKFAAIGLILIAVPCVPALAQNKSVYTSTRAEACRTIESNPDEAGSYEGNAAASAAINCE